MYPLGAQTYKGQTCSQLLLFLRSFTIYVPSVLGPTDTKLGANYNKAVWVCARAHTQCTNHRETWKSFLMTERKGKLSTPWTPTPTLRRIRGIPSRAPFPTRRSPRPFLRTPSRGLLFDPNTLTLTRKSPGGGRRKRRRRSGLCWHQDGTGRVGRGTQVRGERWEGKATCPALIQWSHLSRQAAAPLTS